VPTSSIATPTKFTQIGFFGLKMYIQSGNPEKEQEV
jgi:hypothetical protein